MRYLVLTDIHANLEALVACIAGAKARGYDEALVLGDLVGYGPDPNATVECVRELEPAAIVRGNHDKVACGLEHAESFNVVARRAAQWTMDALTAEHREWLSALPSHRPLCLFGHTHYPVAYELADTVVDVLAVNGSETSIALRNGSKYLVNPGSVGQPRDGNPRSAYAIVDTALRRIELVRVDYSFEDTQVKILQAGLPEVLAQRLAVGR
jgi:predicted phosphodiesterase